MEDYFNAYEIENNQTLTFRILSFQPFLIYVFLFIFCVVVWFFFIFVNNSPPILIDLEQ